METKRRSFVRALTWLCTAVYFCSYLTRINFAAVLVEIIRTEHFTKTAVSIAVTAISITYGLGQLISGYLGDKVKPERLIFGGLAACALFNLLIPVCRTTQQMTVVWGLNGFAQAMLWPPIVKILSAVLNERDYKRAVVRVSWGSSFGTIFVYLVSPLLIMAGSWRTVFLLSAAAALLMSFVWLRAYKSLEGSFPAERTVSIDAAGNSERARFTAPVILMVGVIMFSIVMQGVLRDGISTWMPTYVSEIFHADNSVAIFSSIVLPLFSIACYQFTAWLNERYLKNEMVCAAAVFGIGTAALAVLKLLGGAGMLVSIAAIGIAAAAMHGVNLVLVTIVPAFFKRYGRASLISGTLNSCTYLGSAVSTYGVAVVSETFGWDVTVLTWIAVAVIGTVACLVLVPAWKKFKHSA